MISLPPVSTVFSLPIKRFHDLDCVIETPQYGIREGKGWMNVSPADYGYILGYMGADGDEMDCYLGPKLESEDVFVVDQMRMDGSTNFDEHKCMLGYSSREEALMDYTAGHSHSHLIFASITEMPLRRFYSWLKTGNHSIPLGD